VLEPDRKIRRACQPQQIIVRPGIFITTVHKASVESVC
jgi:hypothetical protein